MHHINFCYTSLARITLARLIVLDFDRDVQLQTWSLGIVFS